LDGVLTGVDHEFEYAIGESYFDLALPTHKIVIEFDGPYHSGKQKQRDQEKTTLAEQNGFRVVRIKVQQAAAVNPELVFMELPFLKPATAKPILVTG